MILIPPSSTIKHFVAGQQTIVATNTFVRTGYIFGSIGSGFGNGAHSTIAFRGGNITAIYDQTIDGGSPSVFLVLELLPANPGQDLFTFIRHFATGTKLKASAAAIYQYGSGTASWQWNGVNLGFSNGAEAFVEMC